MAGGIEHGLAGDIERRERQQTEYGLEFARVGYDRDDDTGCGVVLCSPQSAIGSNLPDLADARAASQRIMALRPSDTPTDGLVPASTQVMK